jgi:hypothetical protein
VLLGDQLGHFLGRHTLSICIHGAKIGNIPESCKDLFAKKAQNIWWFQKK